MAAQYLRSPFTDESDKMTPPASSPHRTRLASSIATLIAGCMLLASCSLLPPSMRTEKAKDGPGASTSAASGAEFGPHTPPRAPPPSANPPALAKVYGGTGAFV